MHWWIIINYSDYKSSCIFKTLKIENWKYLSKHNLFYIDKHWAWKLGLDVARWWYVGSSLMIFFLKQKQKARLIIGSFFWVLSTAKPSLCPCHLKYTIWSFYWYSENTLKHTTSTKTSLIEEYDFVLKGWK